MSSLVVGLLATLAATDYSMKVDGKANSTNYRAAAKIAGAQFKVEKQKEELMNNMMINAKRKNAIINYHLKLFQKQYEIIRKIEFKKGKGIEELEKLELIKNQLFSYSSMPVIASEQAMTDTQLALSFAVLGVGGLMIKESKESLKLAQRNMAKANAHATNIETSVIMLEGLNKHVLIVTQLLEKLGLLYMKSIKHITEILNKNGLNANAYSDKDIEDLNISLMMTKLVYRIINNNIG